MDTVKITGNVLLPDGSIPENADIHFTLTGFSASNSDAVVPHTVVGSIGSSGDIDVDVWPNSGPYSFLRYRITVVEYADDLKQVEVHRHELGSAKVVESADIGAIIPLSVYKCNNIPLTYRKGDTIKLGLIRTSLHGDRLPLDGVDVTVAMRHKRTGVVSQLAVVVDDEGNGIFTATIDSASLDVGGYVWNAAFEKGGEKTSTDFGQIVIVEGLA